MKQSDFRICPPLNITLTGCKYSRYAKYDDLTNLLTISDLMTDLKFPFFQYRAGILKDRN